MGGGGGQNQPGFGGPVAAGGGPQPGQQGQQPSYPRQQNMMSGGYYLH